MTMKNVSHLIIIHHYISKTWRPNMPTNSQIQDTSRYVVGFKAVLPSFMFEQ